MIEGSQNKLSRFTLWMITLTVMLVAMMEALDMTVTNVALPNLMSAFGVSSHSVTWIVTAYMTASAVVMPIVGLLVKKMGRKNLLVICVSGFAISSLLCGGTSHFALLVFFRASQGMFGAALVPLSQSIIMESFPKEECNKGLGVWTVGIMIAPILGPLVGGYIIQILNWRWIFFLNIPICILALLMTHIFISESERSSASVDWNGFFLLVISVGLLQFIVDRGSSLHWFDSRIITHSFIIMLIFGIIFIYRGIQNRKNSVINFDLFKTRNYTICTIMTFIFCASFMGINAIAPIFIQSFLHFTPFLSGFINLPGGIAGMLGMGAGAFLIKNINAKLLMGMGLLISFWSTLLMAHMTLHIGMQWLIRVYMMRNFGFGLFFITVVTLAMVNVPKEFYALASGVYNFARNMGGSIGISYASAQLNTFAQNGWSQMSGFISPYSPGLQFWLAQQTVMPGMSYNNPLAVGLYAKSLTDQSYLQAFNMTFFVLCSLFTVVFIFIFLTQHVKIDKLDIGA